ncbi:aminoacyl-tRNA hydrolase [Leptospira idonii]|uniref:Peptidyl-tRNA hydrolase n=1 Tax=Leptospira idonii TaxID=1193500 RepID=A0A4R9M347_9LEPT|nr:aminoacyl-tRNA hydrolase [Leptospira idonii]TGN20167.1 aminoacyl-tRNA hydrolase [Leptospira idonii]
MHHLLLVGLGNPGDKYKFNRHNIGFIVLDEFAKMKNLSWKESKKFAETSHSGEGYKLHIVKPLEYMNLSGKAVQNFCQSFKIPASQVLVVQDEIDLPFGKLKNKIGGGTAGHNGLKDIVEKIGSDFHRLRFGVGRPEKGGIEVIDFVLQNFNSEEKAALPSLVKESIGKIEDWISVSVTALNQQKG